MYPLLQIQNLTTFYGENKILDNLSFDLNEGEIIMLVGANGAGKSTLLKTIFGIVPKSHGQIIFENAKIKTKPHQMPELGICYVPQEFRVFPEMNVLENIKIGAFILNDKKLVNDRLEELFNFFPMLKKKAKLNASALSGGERQLVALARSLMLKPKILLLDEPSIGLAPKLVAEIFNKIKEINQKFNTSLIIVEHNLKTLLEIADRALILSQGKIIKEGRPKELLHSKVLEEVFFGERA
ncbi:MAG: phosphonate-transporting ATPase, branched-chain amino acid transport system ATP-binding protein [Candidatus Peregrinibacteria bacterium GW2011_GWF2_33_10]|nr:MAG: phosphonate-transporting ATPase, branched-chain amino acid transport system ATP-binding protein [Candidatus Peregrinibacteria bacterium GW2011_GWF2_33_10]OGJ44299.1 MAG: hypothetical protein A2272_05570 [Candidatus Peregrinibacteria bacterium RIFOXYA12_FULL_33_12]OGJ44674.1 MAG: hypothetical protein A2263_01010 [Candidatus Peregrinibacteria bacterium RIFOXYA2_FULL_33_21]OGJ50408.1 MAG: hypothetical protein A2307_06070 [Candidatus Peregrinibacteria bacterium RIFOXYB2_FULL_33_20]